MGRGTARLKLCRATVHQIEVIDDMMHPFDNCYIALVGSERTLLCHTSLEGLLKMIVVE